jgi:DNA-binding transcriptional regulator YiaG
MTPTRIQSIRKQAGLSQTGLAALLRIADLRTIRRWEKGDVPISGPASVVLEMLDRDELPARYTEQGGS